MPEIVADAGIYFDPTSVESTTAAVKKIADSRELRQQLSQRSLERSREFSWQQTADQTFGFLQRCLTALEHVDV